MWIVDVDGERVVVTGSYAPAATDADIAELEAIVSSIRFPDEP